VLDKKSRKGSDPKAERKPAAGSTLKRKTPLTSRAKPYAGPRVRHVEDDLAPAPPPALPPGEKRAALRLIPGGKQAEKPHRKDR